jgi:hypothetical protein
MENSIGKNPLAVLMGRMGGLKGGKARAAKMTAEERSESAKRAATARWSAVRKTSEKLAKGPIAEDSNGR